MRIQTLIVACRTCYLHKCHQGILAKPFESHFSEFIRGVSTMFGKKPTPKGAEYCNSAPFLLVLSSLFLQ